MWGSAGQGDCDGEKCRQSLADPCRHAQKEVRIWVHVVSRSVCVGIEFRQKQQIRDRGTDEGMCEDV